MKRRTFTNIILGASAGMFVTPSIASSLIRLENERSFSDEELKLALEKYCNKIFNSDLNLEYLAPRGRYSFAESYEVEINKNKNSIFDFADEVIEKAKTCGLDASALKDGKIPEGMIVGSSGFIININNSITVQKVDGYAGWDARIIYHNKINILSSVPPGEWNKLKKVEPLSKGRGYTGNLKGIFRIWELGDSNAVLNIDEINPAIKLDKNTSALDTINSKILNDLFSEKILEKLSL